MPVVIGTLFDGKGFLGLAGHDFEPTARNLLGAAVELARVLLSPDAWVRGGEICSAWMARGTDQQAVCSHHTPTMKHATGVPRAPAQARRGHGGLGPAPPTSGASLVYGLLYLQVDSLGVLNLSSQPYPTNKHAGRDDLQHLQRRRGARRARPSRARQGLTGLLPQHGRARAVGCGEVVL